MTLVRQPSPIGSQRRLDAICELVKDGTNGEFAIVHQDKCASGRGENRCTCVPSVWRVERGKT